MFYIHSSDKKNEQSANHKDDGEGKVFEDRIQALRKKGKKRGKRYSLIGIVVSLLILTFTMIMGYILIEQISQITKKVSVVNLKNNFQNVIDPDLRCKTSCCLASLEKIRKYKFVEIGEDGSCEDGHLVNKLQCATSLKWCELKAETEVMDKN